MASERNAGTVLEFLGYVMERYSDRSSNVLERATLQCGRAACHMLIAKIAAGAVADEHWRFLAGITTPPIPEEPAKPAHKPFRPHSSDYRSWKQDLVYRDDPAAEGDPE